jgi:hypothetical protein
MLLLSFNLTRPRRMTERNNGNYTASRSLTESSHCAKRANRSRERIRLIGVHADAEQPHFFVDAVPSLNMHSNAVARSSALVLTQFILPLNQQNRRSSSIVSANLLRLRFNSSERSGLSTASTPCTSDHQFGTTASC